jgi:hypothetical protein
MNSYKWKIAHASVTGTSHIERKTECQDRLDFQILETIDGEVLIVAVADGAGSSEYSQIGAELACSLFIREVTRHFESEEKLENLTKDFGAFWLQYFQQEMAEYAAKQEKQLREFACTFLAAVVGETGAVFYQVGDGAIVCSTTGESESYFFGVVPTKKIYANATDFITDNNAEKHLLYDFLREPIEDLVMFTDGIQAIAVNYQSEMPHEPFLKPMLAPLRESVDVDSKLNENLANFLNSSRINDKTDDDKTIFLASRHIPVVDESITTETLPEHENVVSASNVVISDAANESESQNDDSVIVKVSVHNLINDEEEIIVDNVEVSN